MIDYWTKMIFASSFEFWFFLVRNDPKTKNFECLKLLKTFKHH